MLHLLPEMPHLLLIQDEDLAGARVNISASLAHSTLRISVQ